MNQYGLHETRRCSLHGGEVGAGFIGIEMVEQLLHHNMKVMLVEELPQILNSLKMWKWQPIA